MALARLLPLLALASIAAPAADLDAVTESRLRSHVRFLASDLLEGRGTPSRGLDIASEYIAGEFDKLGLQPGNAGTWFQESEYTARRTNTTGKVRNVIALLPGSDPALKNEYVIVSAHYDHLGKREGEGDQLFNGANDDASGVSGVIEVANALKAAKPKRSVVFLCFWGEEHGLLGSRAYATNPVFPLAKTVANINLEQIGRTDDTEGARVGEFNVTGFDFSDLTGVLVEAAKSQGVKVTKHEKNSDPYFFASDNRELARVGVPAHTVSTAYEFADYHRPGDEWQKLDYTNFVKIVRAVALGVEEVSNRADRVKWNESNTKTASFVEAWKKLQAGGGQHRP